jgi:hypothetical protein
MRTVDPSDRAVKGIRSVVGFTGLEFRQEHGCLSVVSVVCVCTRC